MSIRNDLLEDILAATQAPPAGTVSQGAYEYGHNGAADTLTLADTLYQLTNDGAGTSTTTTYGLTGLADVYNTTTNRLFFDNNGVLALGDTVRVLVEVDVTTTAPNSTIELVIELGAEGSLDYLTIAEETNFKKTGTYLLSRSIMFFMRTSAILTGGARILARSDTAGTQVKVDDYIIIANHTN